MNLATILARIEESGDVPTIGPTASEVVRLVNDPGADARAISRVVEKDPSLTARLLRVANSPYYGFRGQVSSVERAVGLLGTSEIRNIAVSVCIIAELSGGRGRNGFRWEPFWEHSSACGLIAQLLPKRFRLTNSGDEYVAGLLHDIGKVFLGHLFPEEFAAALQLASDEGIEMAAAEKRVFGADHADVGHWVAKQWAFPKTIQQAIALHHRVEECGVRDRLPALIHLADILTKSKCVGFGGDRIAVCLAEDPGWAALTRGRAISADFDLACFTFGLDREVDGARALIRDMGVA